jgi:cysteine desulfurase
MVTSLKVYMDNGSAKPVDRRVLDAMTPYFTDIFGNPASFHSEGFRSLNSMRIARKQVADLVNADQDEIVFTSGATEANNLALLGAAERNKRRGKKVIISEVEHISIVNLSKELQRSGYDVSQCPVTDKGLIRLEELEKLVSEDTILVSVITASGEIGTIQPIKECAEIAHKAGALFHTDATAAMGQIRLDVKEAEIDLMTLSSNDMYGPKGMGALYLK